MDELVFTRVILADTVVHGAEYKVKRYVSSIVNRVDQAEK